MGVKESIYEWIDAHEREYVEDVKRLVAVKSVKGPAEPGKPYGAGPAAALAEAAEMCEGYGFAVKNYENHAVAADMSELEPGVDILAHMDVVGEGDGWDTDPYVAVEKDGILYGRGTGDDKGPAVAALYAMRALKELGIPLKKNVRLILGADEESGSQDMVYYYSKEKPAPGTFSPDSAFPVCNTEKGRYAPMFEKSWEAETVLPRVKTLEAGIVVNILPADAFAVVAGISVEEIEKVCAKMAEELKVSYTVAAEDEDVKIAVKGVGCHASMPVLGVNGITALLTILAALPLADCESTNTIVGLNKLFPHGDGEGKAMGVAMRDEISGELTMALTVLHFNETGANGTIDCRAPVCANEENCRKVADKNLADVGFDVKSFMIPPHHTPEDTPFVQALLSAYEEVTGEKGGCYAMGGGTYVHDVEGGVAFGPGFIGFDGNAHGANEKIKISDMLKAAKIYAVSIYNICK